MPSLMVRIDYDKPVDLNWLNADNVAVALHAYCKNTKFEVTEIASDTGWYNDAPFSHKRITTGCTFHDVRMG